MAFEYLEEFPMQMLAQLETLTGRKARHGLFVINMEYGKNFSGPDKDVFFYDRSVGHTEDAWQSNFLHPVLYYYRHLPTGEWASVLPKHSLSGAGTPWTPLYSVSLLSLTEFLQLTEGGTPWALCPETRWGKKVQE
jgi:hypothetical protein